MTIFMHELKQGRLSLLIWSLAISFMMAACVLIYPEMGEQMNEIGDMFADMGSFSAAFGMDRLNFGEFIGFFGIECGNVLGIGGALFAALLGVTALSKEENSNTAEFLLPHPIKRNRIITEKLAAIFAQLVILNVSVILISTLSMLAADVTADAGTLALMYLAFFIMQCEIAAITFCISAFIKGNGMGLGLGLAAVFYFINIIANLIEETKFLKYITPFGYTESADIISDKALNIAYLSVGIAVSAVCVAVAYIWYNKKDIS